MQDTFAAALSTTQHALDREQSYISRLPVELLAMIFRLVVDETTPRPANDPRHAMFAGTYPVTHTLLTLMLVCQYWHDILVQQPSFWTVVTSKNMNTAETFLRRSGDNLPLVVHMDTIGPPGKFIVVPPFLRECQLQPRLREIHWIMREDTPRKADYLLFPAPRLELLRILYDAEDEERDEVYRDMPPILFAGHAPLLRTVYLGRIGWLPGNRFQSLTFLRLADIPLEFRGFVRLLCNCPVLEHLHLLRIGATAPPGRPLMPGLAIGQATLPRLHCFAFKDMHTASVNDFLFYFAGYRADVSVQVVGIPRAALQPAVVIKTLAREAYGALTSLTLQYHIHNADVVSILATGRDVAINLVSHPTTAEVVNGVRYYYPPLHWGMRQLEAFPLDILQHVCFKYLYIRLSPTNQSLPPRAWRSILHRAHDQAARARARDGRSTAALFSSLLRLGRQGAAPLAQRGTAMASACSLHQAHPPSGYADQPGPATGMPGPFEHLAGCGQNRHHGPASRRSV
ncbi:hypothetical protein FKP32DRAFT_575128 [Trametes sanguinea]|nr:hypothetical protein FKP32DRAFT_575128 [Trametes sanguinea]